MIENNTSTLENKFEMNQRFIDYFKESCELGSAQSFSTNLLNVK